MQKGWIKLHRKLLNNPIWQNPHYLKLWMYCLLQASHSEHDQLVGSQIVKLQSGQFVTGRISLSEEMNRGVSPKKRQSESTWWRDLKRFEEWGMLDIKPNSKYSIVTIANWDFYQESEKEMNSKRTADEQQVNSSWTASEQQVNTNKNVKNLRIKELSNTTTTTAAPVDGFPEVFQAFEANLCMLSPLQRESLGMWFDDFKQNKEIILEAIKIADDRNRKNFGFVEYLFKEWTNNKLTTVEQIQSHERNKFNKPTNQPSGRGRYGSAREEKVPEWFGKNKQSEQPTASNQNIEQERQQLLAELRGEQTNDRQQTKTFS